MFVRDPKYFLGEIPVRNIEHMMSFSLVAEDLPYSKETILQITNKLYDFLRTPEFSVERKEWFKTRIPFKYFSVLGCAHLIEIAAVKSMFHEDAFSQSQERIINTEQLTAKHTVELDPIVLCKTKDGYIVVTAWGDEANDELILNETHN